MNPTPSQHSRRKAGSPNFPRPLTQPGPGMPSWRSTLDPNVGFSWDCVQNTWYLYGIRTERITEYYCAVVSIYSKYRFFRCGHAAPPLQRRAISSSCAAVGARVRQKASTRSSRLLPAEHPAQSKRVRYGGGGLFREASFSLTECLSISVHPISTPPVSTPAWGVSQGEPGRFEMGISYSIQARTNSRFRASVLTDFCKYCIPRTRE